MQYTSEERIRLALLSDDIGRRTFARIGLNEIAESLQSEDSTAAMLAEPCQLSGGEPVDMTFTAIGVIVTRLRVMNDGESSTQSFDQEVAKLAACCLFHLTARAIEDGSPATATAEGVSELGSTTTIPGAGEWQRRKK
mgnify:CR=1 FL=1|tara:strand:- start:13550 stop:13963 length:414 start_codon:yes stop_codon:yes gene_type:complete